MFRWLAVCLILCAGTVLVMNMALTEKGLFGIPGFLGTNLPGDDVGDKKTAAQTANPKAVDRQNVFYHPNASGHINSVQGLVIYDGRIQVTDKQDVASERDGILLFFGTELRQTDVLPPGNDPARKKQNGKFIEENLGYLVVKEDDPQKVPADQLLVFPDSPKVKYRYRHPGEPLDADRVRVALVPQMFRRLEVGDRVEKGDLLALVKPTLALDDLEIKVSKFRAAAADVRASDKTRDEAQNRYDAMTFAKKLNPRAVSEDDYRGAKLTWDRYIEEAIAKAAARDQAERELNAAMTTVRMHEIRALCSGTVKVIYKNRGDAVKNLEPVLHIQNSDHLRVEGVVDVQETRNLTRGMTVSVEPTQLDSPKMPLRGHTQEVTCVAVSKGPRMLIVSGSEDRSLRVWDSISGQELGAFVHPSPVKSVACTGKDAPYNLALVGTADGTARLFNLDKRDAKECVDLGEEGKPIHQSAVTSVAFSPDGQYCLTAGEDRLVVVWRLKSAEGGVHAERLHGLPAAHRSTVTSVQFLPTPPEDAKRQAENGTVQFLTVGRDSTAQVWTMEKDQAPVRTMQFDQRSDAVPILSSDGQRVLIDQAGELRLRSLKDKTRIEGQLRNPPGTAHFSTMALFSPDGKTILTNLASEGRLQLWRTPPPYSRGSELRQMVWNSGAATCAAFAPDNSFVVTGMQDQQVLIWTMPREDEIKARLTARISLIEKSRDSSSREVRIWADMDDPPAWVVPGGTATMVITK